MVVDIEPRNEVVLVGRLSAAPTVRTLPSGDQATTWRLVVPRSTPRDRATRVGHDTIDCTAWTTGLRRRAESWHPGDVIEIEGALRRRHWRSPAGGTLSAYAVEVLRARRILSSRQTP
jgi:single-strand DNA-binding protein